MPNPWNNFSFGSAAGSKLVGDETCGRAVVLSHHPLLGRYNEQQTLSERIALIVLIGADVKHPEIYLYYITLITNISSCSNKAKTSAIQECHSRPQL